VITDAADDDDNDADNARRHSTTTRATYRQSIGDFILQHSCWISYIINLVWRRGRRSYCRMMSVSLTRPQDTLTNPGHNRTTMIQKLGGPRWVVGRCRYFTSVLVFGT